MKPSSLNPMEPKTPEQASVFPSTTDSPLEDDSSYCSTNRADPFGGDSFPDPLCKLNLKETSDFVRAFPMAAKSSNENFIGHLEASAQRSEGNGSYVQKRDFEAPSTPGRPVFGFSGGRKGIPSKWDEAEKWLISSSSCHQIHQKGDAFGGKPWFPGEVPNLPVASFDGLLEQSLRFHGVSPEALMKDKFTDNLEPIFPIFRQPEPAKEGFLFKSSFSVPMKDAKTDVASEVRHRDVGTEMTPTGSLATSRCHTPFKRSSPARHNTPADRSGPLGAPSTGIDISKLKDCHFAKLEFGAHFNSAVWSSREEEEDQISKSLRYGEVDGGRKSFAESGASAWEDEEKAKICIRYQREEAKIQAWINLESAKAEAQSRKLEVKIQKMRSDLEEKLMKRMAMVQRRAQKWRAAAQQQHSQKLLIASEQAQGMNSQFNYYLSHHAPCGCFPCNNL
ncbi:uncharacterized protein LOC103712577 [Phoenix dactylifera]|uniref:Uncharacterized protein LOC103712577 n=1 Tax=Phoenix dactylifera TaxID=42345 RepID=A0A8B7CE70_PHODC|nr:uncharacterized protein LOC103712577 [Phoenix dactylifera]